METSVVCLLLLSCLSLDATHAAPLSSRSPAGPNVPVDRVQQCSALKAKAAQSAAATTSVGCTGNCQSAFSAYKLCEQIGGLNDVIMFEGINSNPGGNYNPETGVYTAPNNGMYQFSFSLLSHTHLLVNLVQNGEHKATVFRSDDPGWYYKYDTVADSVILPLQAGDQVWMVFSAYESQCLFGMEYDFRYTSFSGFQL